MHGNRDFLLGEVATRSAGLTLLNDPTLLDFHGQRYLLSHGDALCLADTDYLRFRALVRSPEWQAQFLAKPLTERLQITRDLRERSEAHKQAQGHDPMAWADVDGEAALAWLEAAQATTLIHGHTHRAGRSDLGRGCERIVLSDWHARRQPTARRLPAAHPPGPAAPFLVCAIRLPDWFQSWLPRRWRQVPALPERLWQATWQAHPFLQALTDAEKKTLRLLVAHFLQEKEFHGAHGLKITDAMAVAIAAQACLPLLHIPGPGQTKVQV